MSGFAGFLDRSESTSPDCLSEIVGRMTETLLHRGPDEGGIWTDPMACVAIGHRRLAIVDPGATGQQPMMSGNGRYVVAFNGEIYNHLDLRKELDGRSAIPDHPLFDSSPQADTSPANSGFWRGHSDTETLLAAIASWGVGETLKRCVGMFAFALWDRHDKVLYLARDRLGEKPLYYGWQGTTLLFGSELKAFRPHPDFRAEIDRDALTLFLRHSYVPAPHTIYQGIRKLPPGTFIALGLHRYDNHPVSYWTAQDAALRGQRQPFEGTEQAAADTLEGLLGQAVATRMTADVPLGACLSGSLGSSLVVASMQVHASWPVKTFTVGFDGQEDSEAEQARAVAQHLRTEHTELRVTPEQALAVIPSLPSHYDEPFADSSQIPTILVAQWARQHVTVSLCGDGADELFGGYSRYLSVMKLWRRWRFFPGNVRTALAGLLTVVPPHAWNTVFRGLGFLLPAGLRYAGPGDKLHKLTRILGARRPEDIYLELISRWTEPSRVVIGANEPQTVLNDPLKWPGLRDVEHRMMYLDTMSYLPDNLLTRVDRAAMGVSLGTRMPFLDHRVLEFAWRLPVSLKIREGEGEWLLRQVLYRYLPQALVDPPRRGSGVPVDVWLRGPLKGWAEALIEPKRLKAEGYFNPALVKEKWGQHQSGRQNRAPDLWTVLMFQAWLEAQ